MKFIAQPSGSIQGNLRVPGDKSISHRSIIFGSIAVGTTTVHGFLDGTDALATISAFQKMGVSIERDQNTVIIHGVGMHGLKPAKEPLDLGNSGTAMRLMTGLLAGQSFDSTLIGDKSLSIRPMLRITKPLSQMLAHVETSTNGTAPLNIHPSKLVGICYDMPIASAQLKSTILLAGLYAKGKTTLIEPAPSRDHTERMLRAFGYQIDTSQNQISLTGGGSLTACSVQVPTDISSAAFFMVAASIAKNSHIYLINVGINPNRTGVIDILNLMGAHIRIENQQIVGGEEIADIHVSSAELHGIDIPPHLVPLAIDEFPVIFIAAAYAKGRTTLSEAQELKVKESDRIASMSEGLTVLGVDNIITNDGVIIEGKCGKPLKGGQVDSHGDHRIAMSFAIASLIADAPIVIDDCANVGTSFPNFVRCAQSVGLDIIEEE